MEDREKRSPWPERIPILARRQILGRARDCALIIEHLSVSRQHAELWREGEKIYIEDLGSRKGTFRNDVMVKRVQLKCGDLVQLGEGPSYRVEKTELVLADEGMALSVQGLGRRASDGGRWLLLDVSFEISPSQFVGIVGPSGSGKSVLIECLSSLQQIQKGKIEFDGLRSLADAVEEFRSEVAYVPQDDLVYPLLRVRENISYAAAIRLPGLERSKRDERIDAALKSMGFPEENWNRRSGLLSGGQRKRLGIAMELVRRPRLLILDEPTSGLDLELQGEVMDVLRLLARQGTTVICSTHTLDTLNYFDSVVAIGKWDVSTGTVVYCGPPNELLSTFGVLDAAKLYSELNSPGSVRRVIGSAVPSLPVESSDTRRTRTTYRATPLSAASPEQACRQALTVCYRSLQELFRDHFSLFLVLLGQPIALAFMVVLSQHDQQGSMFVHFFLIVTAIWMGMTLGVRELVRERRPFLRDHLCGLNQWAYLAGKTSYGLLAVGCQVVLLYTAGILSIYAFVDSGITRSDLLDTSAMSALSVLFIGGSVGLLIGLTISAIARSERAAAFMLPLVILPQILFSRVSYGHGNVRWDDPSPYAPLTFLANYFQQDAQPDSGWLVSLISLLLISRPLLCMLDYGRSTWGALIGDSVLAILLLCLHILVLILIYDKSVRSAKLR